MFRYITCLILPKLFGEVTVQRNRLGLNDQDPYEYRTFEANTKSDKNYQHSKAMLSTFHAIYGNRSKKLYNQDLRNLVVCCSPLLVKVMVTS
jgi:hypothetical protein